MSQSVVAELAPHGVLRAGINMSNFLLVTGKSASGDPEGVSPDMARAIAERLGVPVKYVPFAKPGELADAVGDDVWDIGLIGAEPARAEKIAFTPAYVEIEATYLVPAGSPLRTIADVDKPGVRIAVTARSAYDLWLERNIRHAELVRSDSLASATEKFVRDKLDALAGLRPGLLGDIEKIPGARILDGQFTAVQQAVGTARTNAAGAKFLRDFVEEAKASGLVGRLIEKHKVVGRLSVAPRGLTRMPANIYVRPTASAPPAMPPLLMPQPPIAPLVPPAHVVDLMTAAGSAAFGARWKGMEAKLVECPALSDAMPEFKTTYDIDPHAELRGFDDSAWPEVAATELGAKRGGGMVSFFWFRTTLTIPAKPWASPPPAPRRC